MENFRDTLEEENSTSPSFIENSCPGEDNFCNTKGNKATKKEREGKKPSELGPVLNAGEGFTKSLENLPTFSTIVIDNHLLGPKSSMLVSSTRSKAFRNKRCGYRLWKEGYVRNILVKPNVIARKVLFIAKAKVHASMKNISYTTYVHFDQTIGDILEAKCNCKAGQGGVCKHVAALLYSLLDYLHLGLKEIPPDITCTQVAQKWHVPSSANLTLTKAVKFTDITFEKAEVGKKRKRPIVSGERPFCALPSYARQITPQQIEDLASDLRKAGKASLLCSALASNGYQPCKLFITSCNDTVRLNQDVEAIAHDNQHPIINALFIKMEDAIDNVIPSNTAEEISEIVGVSKDKAIEICINTLKQADCAGWYLERSKRITASIFGKVINRRKTLFPKALLKQILEKPMGKMTNYPVPLKWGIEHESVAIEEYLRKKKLPLTAMKSCGFVINPKWPWLGCSPDGIIIENGSPAGCIEVKCPYSKRDCSIKEAALTDKSFFMKVLENKCELKVGHFYYYQCQGIMNILELPWVDFVVFTTRDIHIERIFRDQTLWIRKMLPELTRFFSLYILPKLLPSS